MPKKIDPTVPKRPVGRPRKPYGTRKTGPQVRLAEEQYVELDKLAQRTGRTVAMEVYTAIAAWLKKNGGG